jgi:predicted nucleic acid-binding protein
MDVATPVVVDTDVVSFLFKSHSLAAAYQAILAGRALAVSLFTLAEIEYGMEAKNWGATRRDLMRRFLTRFTTLLPDTETARVWARIKSGCEKKGRPVVAA